MSASPVKQQAVGIWTCVMVVALAMPAQAQTPPAQSPPPSSANVSAQVPGYTDVVMRGLRMRLDLGGRYNSVGLPDPPVRLEVDEAVNERNDMDVQGVVLMGWDRPFGVPVVGDIAGEFNVDANPDSPVSPFLDDQSAFPRARLYSAFIGLSGSPAEPWLQPFKLNLGRMTEVLDSPLTYDGASLSARFSFGKAGHLSLKAWGGLDAPQRLGQDPFTRTDPKAYGESYVTNPEFVSLPGGIEVVRTPVAEPIYNPVGGLMLEARFVGVGLALHHALMPAQTLWDDQLLPMQRSKVALSYSHDGESLLGAVALDLKATDFVPRSAGLRGDVLTGDGTTRIGTVVRAQFLEDITAYDGTFRARDPAAIFDPAAANAFEQLRVRDQIRHLNIGPPKRHLYAMVDGERQLGGGFSVLANGRVRHHFDDDDVDFFRTNLYEGGAGLSWSPGFALELGAELGGGFLNSGKQNGLAYDLKAEGVVTFAEGRSWARFVLLEGKLTHLSEVFVRRNDVQSKGILASGQWSGAVSTTLRYDVLDFWSVSARFDGDALSPIDALNGSYYLSGLVATSVRF